MTNLVGESMEEAVELCSSCGEEIGAEDTSCWCEGCDQLFHADCGDGGYCQTCWDDGTAEAIEEDKQEDESYE